MKDILTFLDANPESLLLVLPLIAIAIGIPCAAFQSVSDNHLRMEAIKSGYNQVYDKESGKTLWVKPTISAEQ